jgi:hypothetical protein
MIRFSHQLNSKKFEPADLLDLNFWVQPFSYTQENMNLKKYHIQNIWV